MMTKFMQLSLCLALPFAALAQSDMPTNGTPGKCYAKCLIADKYETVTEQVETRGAFNGTDVLAPNFQTVSRKVMVKAAGTRLVPTAAAMETVTEKVMIKAESKRMVVVPAEYETYTERVEVRPATKRLVTVPGQYETITDQQIYLGTPTGVSTGKGTAPNGFNPSELQSVGDALSRDGGAEDGSGVNGGRGRLSSPYNPNSPANTNGGTGGNGAGGKKGAKPTDPNNPNGGGAGAGDGNGAGAGSGNGYRNAGAYTVDGSTASELSMVGTIMPYVIKGATVRVERTPVQYETVTEKIMVSPATTRWEKKVADRNCLSADPNDCSVWCLIDVPAEYKTVTKQKAKECAAGYTRTTSDANGNQVVGGKEECIKIVQVGAEYGARQIVKAAPSVREEVIPAEFKTITMQRVKTPASVREEVIPAEYATITKQVLKSDGGYVRQVVPAEYQTASLSMRSGLALKPGYRWTTSGLVYNPSYTGGTYGTSPSATSPNGTSVGAGTNPNGGGTGTNPNGTSPNGGNGTGAGSRPGTGGGNGAGPGGNGAGDGGAMVPGDVPADPYAADPYANWDNAGCPAGYGYDAAEGVCKKSVNVPAAVTTVTKKNLVTKGGFSEWREVVCAANVTSAVIKDVQAALKAKGYDPGASNNVLNAQTKAALTKFQKDNGLPIGSMDLETLKALGVNY